MFEKLFWYVYGFVAFVLVALVLFYLLVAICGDLKEWRNARLKGARP